MPAKKSKKKYKMQEGKYEGSQGKSAGARKGSQGKPARDLAKERRGPQARAGEAGALRGSGAYTTPCDIMASATLRKPAILAPATKLSSS